MARASLPIEMQGRTETWWGRSQLKTCNGKEKERWAKKVVVEDLGEVFSAQSSSLNVWSSCKDG